jgi:peptide/nickel transport system substrate-binding protein
MRQPPASRSIGPHPGAGGLPAKDDPLLVQGLLLGLVVVLAACGGLQTSPSADDSEGASAPPALTGGTVRIGVGGSAEDLNPGMGESAADHTLYDLIYDTPIAVTSDGEYVPELATEWEVADDGVTWTLTIRDDATFHDGVPLTAEDVAYTVQLYKDTEAFRSLRAYTAIYETIEATDATHIQLTTATPIGNFESTMASIYVLPQHIWEAEADPVAFLNEEMIGSGPFRLEEHRHGEFTELAANNDYWNGRPNVDGVILHTYSNADARVRALTGGDVDAITEFPITAITALRGTENVHVQVANVGAGGSLRDIFFNMVAPENCPTEEGAVCSGHTALQDVHVRRALATAVNKREIIDVAYLGEATAGLSLVPIGLGDYYAGEVEDYAYDPAAAADLLEEAGYTDSDGNGVRECLAEQDCSASDGELRFHFHYADVIDIAPSEAELLHGMWADIGVQIEIQSLDPDTMMRICCPMYDYDIMLWGWGSAPDPSFLLSVALCAEIPTGFSETGYCNPEYDELFDQQAVETDRAARIGIIHEMQEILVRDVPYIIPYYQKEIQAWRTDAFVGWPEIDPTLGLEDPTSLAAISRAP